MSNPTGAQNYYLVHTFDDTLILTVTDKNVSGAAVGPNGSYYALFSHYMVFTPRVDRLPIRVSSQDMLMECIDAVTRLVGRKLNVYSTVNAWFTHEWGFRLGTSNEMTVITFLVPDELALEMERALEEELYNINDRGVQQHDVEVIDMQEVWSGEI